MSGSKFMNFSVINGLQIVAQASPLLIEKVTP